VEARSTLESTVASNSVVRSSERHFYLWMAGVFVADRHSAFHAYLLGARRQRYFPWAAILHIHGALLFSWTLFYFMQTAWVASGHTAHPPRVGAGGNSSVQRHDVFDPRRADNRHAPGGRARVRRRGTPIAAVRYGPCRC